MAEIDNWLAAARRTLNGETVPPTGNAPDGPVAMVVAPADMAIDPHTLCGAAPGTLYVIRVPGGLVPPSSGDGADRSIAAALEYAVRVAEVDRIILLTHPECGMLRCLLDDEAPRAGLMLEGQFLPGWTRLIAPAVARATRADISRL
jgi:carbonic anhydrase